MEVLGEFTVGGHHSVTEYNFQELCFNIHSSAISVKCYQGKRLGIGGVGWGELEPMLASASDREF
jgi:hypothetical protein